MKHKVISFIITILAIFGLSLTTITPTFAEDICSNPNVPAEVKAASGCPGTEDVGNLGNSIQSIINGIIASLGIVAVVVVVIGGVQYMTSSGDPGKTKRAKDTILYAAIGLVICVLSFAIVNFVIINIIGGQQDGATDEEETGYIINTYTAQNPYCNYCKKVVQC